MFRSIPTRSDKHFCLTNGQNILRGLRFLNRMEMPCQLTDELISWQSHLNWGFLFSSLTLSSLIKWMIDGSFPLMTWH